LTNGIGRQKSIVDWLAVTRYAMHVVLNKIQRYDVHAAERPESTGNDSGFPFHWTSEADMNLTGSDT